MLSDRTSTTTGCNTVTDEKSAAASTQTLQVRHVDALIVGAGWAGLWSLYRLRQKGFRCLCVEAHEDVGGVWLYTKYPGCRNETVSSFRL